MKPQEFKKLVAQGIPDKLPTLKSFDTSLNHAPKRKDILSSEEKKLAIKNALRYFPKKFHAVLAKEFAEVSKQRRKTIVCNYMTDKSQWKETTKILKDGGDTKVLIRMNSKDKNYEFNLKTNKLIDASIVSVLNSSGFECKIH